MNTATLPRALMQFRTVPRAETIKVGDRVRSYDFPECPDRWARGCYVEGTVTKIASCGFDGHGCQRYHIRVEKQVWQHDPDTAHMPMVYPPVNGTPTVLGRVTSGVEKV